MAEKEARLIDANALIEWCRPHGHTGEPISFETLKEYIEAQPTIEAYTEQDVRDAYNDGYSTGMEQGREKAEVHGRWEIVKHKGDLALYARCQCGYEYNASRFNGQTLSAELCLIHNYCPDCGAKMGKED